MSSLASIVEALVGGYLAVVLLQVLFGFLITREGRGVLMQGDRLSLAYYLQIGAGWLLSSAAAAMLIMHVLRDTPLGPVITGAVGLLLILLVLRNHLKIPHQQTVGVNFFLFLCIALGSAGGCALLLLKA